MAVQHDEKKMSFLPAWKTNTASTGAYDRSETTPADADGVHQSSHALTDRFGAIQYSICRVANWLVPGPPHVLQQ
jgi:hypothetical protein